MPNYVIIYDIIINDINGSRFPRNDSKKMSMPASWREFLGFRIPLRIRIQRWPPRLGKFKACQSSDSPKSDKQKSRCWGSLAYVDIIVLSYGIIGTNWEITVPTTKMWYHRSYDVTYDIRCMIIYVYAILSWFYDNIIFCQYNDIIKKLYVIIDS